MRLRFLLVVPLLALAAAGCADQDPGDATASPLASITASPLTPEGSSSAGSLAPGAADTPEVKAAVADLSTQLGVSESEVEVVSVQEVTWSDASMGCPQPGMNYTQQLVNGQLVVLSVGGTRYEYHSGGSRPLFLCADPRPPAQVS